MSVVGPSAWQEIPIAEKENCGQWTLRRTIMLILLWHHQRDRQVGCWSVWSTSYEQDRVEKYQTLKHVVYVSWARSKRLSSSVRTVHSRDNCIIALASVHLLSHCKIVCSLRDIQSEPLVKLQRAESTLSAPFGSKRKVCFIGDGPGCKWFVIQCLSGTYTWVSKCRVRVIVIFDNRKPGSSAKVVGSFDNLMVVPVIFCILYANNWSLWASMELKCHRC